MMISDAEWTPATAGLTVYGERMKELTHIALLEGGVRPHTVMYRVKERSSAERKIERKARADYSLKDVTDLLGLRVITYFDYEVNKAAEIIEAEFAVDHANSVDKRTTLDPDRFGYLSLHYVVTLGASRRKLAEYRTFEGVRFEIQIRSILQHAWAEIEHDLGYKSAHAIPAPLRRRFSRLAGLLELADEEFTQIRRSVTEYETEVQEKVRENTLNLPIDRDSVAAYIGGSARLAALEQKIIEAFGSPPGQQSGPKYAEARARELLAVGFTDLDDVDRVLQENGEILWRFVRNRFNARRIRGKARRTPNRGVILLYVAIAEALKQRSDVAAGLLDELGVGSELQGGLRAELEHARQEVEHGD
jgi:ppGpp synthetase/RelA/SpoT-type nucleotidyltranferase